MSPLQKIGRFFYVMGEKIFMPENRLCPVKHPACPCTAAKGVCPVCDWNHDVLFSSEAARGRTRSATMCHAWPRWQLGKKRSLLLN